MLNAARIRLYPNAEQQQKLAVQFGCARWVWNNALALTQQTYRETGKGLSYHALAVRLPKLEQEKLARSKTSFFTRGLRCIARLILNTAPLPPLWSAKTDGC